MDLKRVHDGSSDIGPSNEPVTIYLAVTEAGKVVPLDGDGVPISDGQEGKGYQEGSFVRVALRDGKLSNWQTVHVTGERGYSTQQIDPKNGPQAAVKVLRAEMARILSTSPSP